eukprot:Nitzschia sp. Nitz4//scaffold89_size161592//157337//157771//NITZ4_002406-RA/size161592-processed-gene-0.27-mRNA-1//1//CDS//3329559700//5988//frame0
MKDMTPENRRDNIMHGSLEINPSVSIWASDRNPAFNKPPIVVGDNVQISLILNDKNETERVFAELSKEGTNIGPISDMPWGGYFGNCTDKFGIHWMFNYAHPSKDGKREIEEAAASLKEAASQAMESAAALGAWQRKDKTSAEE